MSSAKSLVVAWDGSTASTAEDRTLRLSLVRPRWVPNRHSHSGTPNPNCGWGTLRRNCSPSLFVDVIFHYQRCFSTFLYGIEVAISPYSWRWGCNLLKLLVREFSCVSFFIRFWCWPMLLVSLISCYVVAWISSQWFWWRFAFPKL